MKLHPKWYVLRDGKAVHEPDVEKWAAEMSKSDLQIALDRIGNVTVSTVFLGVDINLHDGPPILFETALFNGDKINDTSRYSTLEQAKRGHQEAVEYVKDWYP